MLYRVMIGIVPMILVALFVSGAIPLGNVLPSTEYRSSAVRAAEAEGAKDQDVEAQPGKPEAGKPYRARTAEGALSQHIGVIPNDAIEMMEDNMQAMEELEQMAKEHREEMRQEARTPGWKPKSGGWGSQN